MVRNPVCRNVVYRVKLDRENVDLMTFMTKNPKPIIPFLDEIIDMGIRCSFQITVNPYGKDIEPGVPDKSSIAESFRTLSDRIGRENVIWRYDPVILNSRYDVRYHSRKFHTICNELQGYVDTCTFGFVDIHKKLEGLSEKGMIRHTSSEEIHQIASSFSDTAAASGIKLNCCCAREDLSVYGISYDGCIGKNMMRSMNIPFEMAVPLRDRCTCVKTVDIGHYDTCYHDCAYCYANRADNRVRETRSYDVSAEMLYGIVGKDDDIVDIGSRKTLRIDDF